MNTPIRVWNLRLNRSTRPAPTKTSRGSGDGAVRSAFPCTLKEVVPLPLDCETPYGLTHMRDAALLSRALGSATVS